MAEEKAPKWSDEEERLLHHEAFVAELLDRRKGRVGESASHPPAWQRFLESAGGAALVTVLLGSVAAGIINSLVQEKLKERELALASYQDELKQRQDIATRIVELVGATMGATEDIIFLTTDEFDPARFSGEQRNRILDQRNKIQQAYNATDRQWQVEPEELALLIGLHTHGQADIGEAWRASQQAVTAYKYCAEDWYARHQRESVTSEDARSACGKQKAAARTSLEQFAQRIEANWQGASPPPRAAGEPASR
ncbi:MAG TPA: hypothetical protein VL523_17880 [Terriglobia bacterium]|nr:hypothetical protein [Terriglobia bacterium]